MALYFSSKACSCACWVAETGSSGASIGFKPSSFAGKLALIWFVALFTPGLTFIVAGIAGVSGTVPASGVIAGGVGCVATGVGAGVMGGAGVGATVFGAG